MTAPIVLHRSRTPFDPSVIVVNGVPVGSPTTGDGITLAGRSTPGQLWERVGIPPLWGGPPKARTNPASKLYCDYCNYDMHTCGGCGEPLAHGQQCAANHD